RQPVVAILQRLLTKEKRTFFFEKKFTATPSRRWSFGQESKRNKWREARREAPFMPDCDLDQSSTFCSQRPMPTGYQGRSPCLSRNWRHNTLNSNKLYKLQL